MSPSATPSPGLVASLSGKTPVHAYSDRQVMRKPGYEIYHYRDEGIRRIDLHHHDFYELYFFLSGEVEYHIEGRIYRLRSGDIALINPTELHQARVLEEGTSYERMVLWIDKPYLRGLSTDQTDLAACFDAPDKTPVISPAPGLRQEVHRALLRLLSLESDPGFGADLLARACLTELLIGIRRSWLADRRDADGLRGKSRLIDGVIAWLEAHLSEPLHLDRLAEQFFLSKYHLSREFRKYTGVSLHRYIVLKRLIAAKELILADEPVSLICQACGFGDESGFYRAFRSVYGMTPGQYHARMRPVRAYTPE